MKSFFVGAFALGLVGLENVEGQDLSDCTYMMETFVEDFTGRDLFEEGEHDDEEEDHDDHDHDDHDHGRVLQGHDDHDHDEEDHDSDVPTFHFMDCNTTHFVLHVDGELQLHPLTWTAEQDSNCYYAYCLNPTEGELDLEDDHDDHDEDEHDHDEDEHDHDEDDHDEGDNHTHTDEDDHEEEDDHDEGDNHTHTDEDDHERVLQDDHDDHDHEEDEHDHEESDGPMLITAHFAGVCADLTDELKATPHHSCDVVEFFDELAEENEEDTSEDDDDDDDDDTVLVAVGAVGAFVLVLGLLFFLTPSGTKSEQAPLKAVEATAVEAKAAEEEKKVSV